MGKYILPFKSGKLNQGSGAFPCSDYIEIRKEQERRKGENGGGNKIYASAYTTSKERYTLNRVY